jgi:hypothetical protein
LYGNKEVVAPISAPILQMVAIPKIQNSTKENYTMCRKRSGGEPYLTKGG